jgi:energy-converting hydrogenase Eha subunit E
MAVYGSGVVVHGNVVDDPEPKHHLSMLSPDIAMVGFQLIFMAYDNSSGKIAVHHARVLTKYRWVRRA